MNSPVEPTVPELRQSVEELSLSVTSLANRVSGLSDGIKAVNGLREDQNRLGLQATAAVEEANKIARDLAAVKATVIPREEHVRIAKIVELQEAKRKRRMLGLIVVFFFAFYLAVFAIAPIEASQCVTKGPNTVAAQEVCNAISPFESHPLGGRAFNGKILQQQIDDNAKRLDNLEKGITSPTTNMARLHPAPASQYDFTSQGALLTDFVVITVLSGGLMWARHREERGNAEIDRLSHKD